MDKFKQRSYTEWLVINSQRGDERAFDALIRSWYPRLLRYGIGRLQHPDQARDALQDCLVSVSRGIAGLRDPARFPAWCFQIMERRCTDLVRRRIRERGNARQLQQWAENESGLDPASPEQALTVQQALALLDEPVARLLRLYYLEGFNVGEIAAITGVPSGTVKSRLFNARSLLAKILEK